MRKVSIHFAADSEKDEQQYQTPHLLHTKVSSSETIKEELVSSCSEEVVLYSEVEINKTM